MSICQIKPFKCADGSIDVLRWWIKTEDNDLRYWACAGTKEAPVLYRSVHPYYFSSREEAIHAAEKNKLYLLD